MKLLTFMLLAVTGLVTGCVGLIPVPSLSSQPADGRVIQAQEAAFIVPGLTTRAKVVEQVGDRVTDEHDLGIEPSFDGEERWPLSSGNLASVGEGQ